MLIASSKTSKDIPYQGGVTTLEISKQKKKIKTLQQKVRRKESCLTTLSETLEELRNQQLLDEEHVVVKLL